jgi:hypothetical protein
VFVQFIDIDDIRMLEQTSQARLVNQVRILEQALLEHFEGHGLSEPCGPHQLGPKDAGHPPLTEYGQETIATQLTRQVSSGPQLGRGNSHRESLQAGAHKYRH